MDVLINHPQFGSLWLSKATIKRGHVTGEAWDNTDVGSPYLPDDYMGEYITLSFPITCIRQRKTQDEE